MNNEKLARECITIIKEMLTDFPGLMGADEDVNAEELKERITTYLSLSPEINKQYDKNDFGK